MSSLRVRPPDNFQPPLFTVAFYSVGGDGLWMVLENGRERSWHSWKWQAQLAARKARARAAHTDLGGDPVEVQSAQSLAERQSALNDLSGSPTSPPKRDPGDARAAQEGER
jgi:hypothetical protein